MHPVDIVFGALVLTAFGYAVHLTRRSFFLIDDWRLVQQAGSFGGLFKPYNDHLSLIILATYRACVQVLGFDYTVPRIVGLASLYAVPPAYFLIARRRFGPLVAAILSLPLLWYGEHVDLFSGAFNHYLVLLGAICCAGALMSGRRADWILGAAVSLSLLSAGGGIAVVAACLVHNACTRPQLRRWIVVLAPAGLWFAWWLFEQRRLNNAGSSGLTASQTLRFMRNLGYTPFEAVALGSALFAVLLGMAYLVYGAWTISKGTRQASNFLAWSAANLVWAYGIANNRAVLADVNAFRYRYLALGFALLAIVPCRPIVWPERVALDSDRRWVAAGVLLLLIVGTARALSTVDDMRQSASKLAAFGAAVRAQSLVLELGPSVVPDNVHMDLGMAALAARDVRALFERYGAPSQTSRMAIDEQLVDLHVIRAVAARRGTDCTEMSEPLTVAPGLKPPLLWSAHNPVEVQVRRFGDHFVRLATVNPGQAVQIAFAPLQSQLPLEIHAYGACTSSALR